MVLYPEVQRKAQAEVDAVIGGSRLPTLADKSSLPYLECVLSEVLRWQPVSALGKKTSLFLIFLTKTHNRHTARCKTGRCLSRVPDS